MPTPLWFWELEREDMGVWAPLYRYSSPPGYAYLGLPVGFSGAPVDYVRIG